MEFKNPLNGEWQKMKIKALNIDAVSDDIICLTKMLIKQELEASENCRMPLF